jgi:hypothetical protein
MCGSRQFVTDLGLSGMSPSSFAGDFENWTQPPRTNTEVNRPVRQPREERQTECIERDRPSRPAHSIARLMMEDGDHARR